MPATREQVYEALKAADAAGNAEDARQLAEMYASMKPAAPVPAKPRGPVSEFVRGFAGPAPTRNEMESYPRAAGRAVWNIPSGAANAVKELVTSPIELAKLAFTKEGHQAAGSMYDQAASVLRGGIQHVREMSPQEFRGSAPAMDKTGFNNFVSGVKRDYGTGPRAARTIANNPTGALLTAAAVIDPALRLAKVRGGVIGATGRGMQSTANATRNAAIAAKRATVDPVVDTTRHITEAERRAKAAADIMREEATGTFKDARSTAMANANTFETRASDAARSATRGRRFADTLAERRAAAKREAEAPVLDIGTPRTLSEMGDELRGPALVKQSELEASMRAADEKYRAAMQAVAEDRAAAGVGVSDSKLAKILIKRSREVVEPDPVKRPRVGSVPADSAGAKLHKDLLDVLSPQQVPLTVKEAAAARRAGIEVQVAPDGSFSRTIKPSLQNVEDFSRRLGKILEGKVEGYEAINRIEAGQMYANLQKVMDQYVSGARGPVQQNWREGKAALAPFEEVRAGQRLVGVDGAGEAKVPASNIPSQVMSGGRDTIRQTAAVAGEASVANVVRSQVQNALAGAKSSADVDAMLRGTKLGDAVAADPDLAERVASYTERLRASEAAAARVTAFERRAQIALKRSDRLAGRSATASERAAKAKDVARGYERDIAALEIAEPKAVGAQYTSMLEIAHKDGLIDTSRYQRGLQLAARAEKDFKLKTTRDRWIRYAGYLAGLGVAPGLAADILSHKD